MLTERAIELIEESARMADEVCKYAGQHHQTVCMPKNIHIEQLRSIQLHNMESRMKIREKYNA